jgi:hypothetical protein
VRRFLVTSAVFALGASFGALAASHVWMETSRHFYEAVLAEHQDEQQLLAERARRNGDVFREALHRVNAADAQAEIGFRWLKRYRSVSDRDRFVDPWEFQWMVWSMGGLPPLDEEKLARGRQILESHRRSRAAIALEQIGLTAAADVQWARALELQPAWSTEDHRRFHGDRMQSFSEEAEAAYLDSTTFPELWNALARTRRRDGVQ